MQKSFLSLVAVFGATLLLGAGCSYNFVEDKSSTVDDVPRNSQEDIILESAGTYEDYNSSKLALADSGKVVLFFKASWCPSCNSLDKDILANLNNIPKGTYILKVDYDNSTELKKKYGITYQHTFVQVDSKGNQIEKWAGSPTLSELVSHIK